uniref:Uncharacterized protein n=1 Tax=Cacopsylla melanoneura TaxID=428564 RepID=A0A8D9AQ11_9HEMI
MGTIIITYEVYLRNELYLMVQILPQLRILPWEKISPRFFLLSIFSLNFIFPPVHFPPSQNIVLIHSLLLFPIILRVLTIHITSHPYYLPSISPSIYFTPFLFPLPFPLLFFN